MLHRVHTEDTALVQQTIGRAAQDGKDFDFEHRLLMPDGSLKHVHIVAYAERDESGKLEFVGAVMDVTAAKLAEEALRRSEGYLAEAQRLTGTGSWAWNVASRRRDRKSTRLNSSHRCISYAVFCLKKKKKKKIKNK